VTPRVAILAHFGDAGAVALATHLRRRGVAQAVFADERAFVRARLVHHPPSGSLNDKTMAPIPDAVYLPDGPVLDGNVDLIVSRLSALAPALQATPARRDYADAEAFAFVLSWLAALGDRTLNRPSPMGLAGHQPDVLLLARLAAAVGLATPQLRLSINGASAAPGGSVRLSWPGSTTPVAFPTQALPATGPPLPMPVMFSEPVSPVAVALVAGRRVVGAPQGLEERTAALVAAAKLNVAEVTFGSAGPGGSPLVVEVQPVPRIVDFPQLDLLAKYAEERACRHHAVRAA
jgi:hypothetical protein